MSKTRCCIGYDFFYNAVYLLGQNIRAAVSPDYGNCSGYGLDLHSIGTFTQPFLISESGIVVDCSLMEY